MIVAVVGPSGAGKDTLLAEVCRMRSDLRLVRRVITRPTGAGGEDFEGVTEEEFSRRRARGDFALWWEAHGLSYAIPKAQLPGGGTVLFNGSRAVLPDALRVFPDLRVIVVTASDAVLAERLTARGRESEADVLRRLARARFTLPEDMRAVTVVNDGTIEEGTAALLAALQPVRA